MGLKEAMKWFDSIGLSKMSIEVDCKQMIDGISKRFNTNFMVGAAIDICKTLLWIYPNFISFIIRQSNNVVHLLVSALLSYISFHIHDYVSSWIKTIIINEWVKFTFVKKKNIYNFILGNNRA